MVGERYVIEYRDDCSVFTIFHVVIVPLNATDVRVRIRACVENPELLLFFCTEAIDCISNMVVPPADSFRNHTACTWSVY
jgi:hypothetical protein